MLGILFTVKSTLRDEWKAKLEENRRITFDGCVNLNNGQLQEKKREWNRLTVPMIQTLRAPVINTVHEFIKLIKFDGFYKFNSNVQKKWKDTLIAWVEAEFLDQRKITKEIVKYKHK